MMNHVTLKYACRYMHSLVIHIFVVQIDNSANISIILPVHNAYDEKKKFPMGYQ